MLSSVTVSAWFLLGLGLIFLDLINFLICYLELYSDEGLSFLD